MCYDIFLFIEIIETIAGIQFLRSDEKDGVKIRIYQGLDGRTVFIDVSEEEITDDTGKAYLFQLGVPYLIDALFPTNITPSLTKE